MRCYGCNATTHTIRFCPVVQRPEEVEVEFPSTFDISERVQSLSKFAIFRAKGAVSEGELRAAMRERYWGPRWQGKIIPTGKFSFLVGFPNEFRRDGAVLDGTVNFGGFAGTFICWSEGTGVHKVLRPVVVWITVVGFPLQCWGKDEVSIFTSSFGKLKEISSNFYQKTSANSFKILVEVEDISLVPKSLKCSYKAVTDNRIRYYIVELFPSSICIPVSQCNEDNYRLYAEEGGSGQIEEEGWSNGSEAEAREVLRAAIRREEANREAGLGGEEAAVADPIPAEAQAQFTSAGIDEEGDVVHAPRGTLQEKEAEVSEGERERRRKGKGIMADAEGGGAIMRAGPYASLKTTLDPILGTQSTTGPTSEMRTLLSPARTQTQEPLMWRDRAAMQSAIFRSRRRI